MTGTPPLEPRLVSIAGRDENAVAEAARRFGFAEHTTDWHALIADERVGLLDYSVPTVCTPSRRSRPPGPVLGTLEPSRFATGRKNALRWEIDGAHGSLAFDLERLNELEVYMAGSHPAAPRPGLSEGPLSEAEHPFLAHWWPAGHIIGWEHFLHELHHLLTVIRDGASVRPDGADFEDGYRAAEVCDAILASAEAGERANVVYR